MQRLSLLIVVALAAITLAYSQPKDPPAKPPPFFKNDKNKEDPNIRSLQGTVKDDAENALEGAVVKLKNVKTLQVRSFITKPDGTYAFGGLSTNTDYEVKADHNGLSSDTRTLSVFDARKVAIINLKIEPKKKED
jgi:hypothetical protein